MKQSKTGLYWLTAAKQNKASLNDLDCHNRPERRESCGNEPEPDWLALT